MRLVSKDPPGTGHPMHKARDHPHRTRDLRLSRFSFLYPVLLYFIGICAMTKAEVKGGQGVSL